MIYVASGIKVAVSLGAGPEARIRPPKNDVVPHAVRNKKRPPEKLIPQVPGATYTISAAG